MVEDSVSQTVDASSSQAVEVSGHEEGPARGILREAILKVMEEIEHHEKKARHHLQQASELRKALRESVSFLHEEGEKKTPRAIPGSVRSDKTGGPPLSDKVKQGVSSNKQRQARKK
jgi:hypothetical protein